MTLGLSKNLWGQELSPIQVFSPQETASGNQNWMISQGEDQTVYFANNQGLLGYNGAQWKLHPAKDNSIVRSVKVIDSKVYSSSYRDFGYWEKNSAGELIYTSLSKKLQLDILEDEQFWNILIDKKYIVFQSLNRLILFDPREDKIVTIPARNTLLKSFKVEGVIYFQVQDEGLFRIVANKAELVSSLPIFKEQALVNLTKKKEALLVITQDQGLYLWENNRLKPWEKPTRLLKGNYTLYSAIALKNKGFALGTIGQGLLLLSEDGRVEQTLTQEKGLSNNTVLSLFEDEDANLWIGLDNGINLINQSSAFKEYFDAKGQLGSIYTSALKGEYFYLGTNQGLFVKKRFGKDDFELVKNTQGQVWNLSIIDGQLFCGHNRGAFLIQNKEAKLISNVMGTWLFKQHPTQPNFIVLGNFTGLYVMEKKAGEWRYRNKIEGFDISSRFFEFSSPTKIVVNHEYKGVYTVKMDAILENALEVKLDQVSCISCNSSLVKFDHTIYYQAKDQLFKYIAKGNRFARDTLISSLKNDIDFKTGKLLNDTEGKLWMFTKKKLFLLHKPKGENAAVAHEFFLNQNNRKHVSGFEHINPLEKNTFLIGTNRGYLTVDLDKLEQEVKAAKITSITSDNKENKRAIDLEGETTLANNYNNLTFTFSNYDFNRYGKTRYQYKLEGEDKKWSEWTENSVASYANLNAGDYRFLLRIERENAISNTIKSEIIRISPPWYFNRIAISFYAIVIVLVLISYNSYYRRKLKRQHKKLKKENKRLLEIQELEAQKEIIRLRNEQLKKDIESKSRELAVATMSTLKRNEFLNTIKAELKLIEGDAKAAKLIKSINNKLNNTDDWEYFKKAFDNTDQALFSKLKTAHPALTKNDLKLCAYLRLNLSSKEIAPLLNISIHSVEVKRYRLRKKMGLSRSQGIVEYIMTF